ncbi:hypothetical protein QFW77_13125 [Luteimonas sp. RD2P54]|uniref:Uncharacterized protein n=1 Tax=Luteimonas endophytica TaxID=3042023 RepID=A0ABT6JAQ9_9GAMM|nr:hypothetical protein [Luteimonas endophytica]MDH5823920.1 hypothetical protein [Luteimonas endophytica]
MSSAIAFLESLGREPHFNAGRDRLVSAIAATQASEAERSAMLEGDAVKLAELLGGASEIYCMVIAPDGGETESPQQSPDDDRPDDPDSTPDPDGRDSPVAPA